MKILNGNKQTNEYVDYVLTSVQHELVGFIIVLTGILGIWLNGCLLVKIKKQLRTDSLVANLAFANIGLCLFAFPFSSIASFQHKWKFGDETCQYYGFTSLFFGFVMMASIPMIAIDEYLLFDWGPYIIKRSKVNKIMIIYTWINSIFWALTPLIGWGRYGYETSGTSCTIVYFPNDNYSSYMVCCFITCYLIPLIVLLYCKLRYRIVDNSKTAKKSVTLSKRTMSLIVSFLFCWTLFTILRLWPIFTLHTAPLSLSIFAPLIAKLHTIATPLIFLNTNDDVLKI